MVIPDSPQQVQGRVGIVGSPASAVTQALAATVVSPASLDTLASQECRGTPGSVVFQVTQVTAASLVSLEPILEQVGIRDSQAILASAVTRDSLVFQDILAIRASLVILGTAGCLAIQGTPELVDSAVQIRVRLVTQDFLVTPASLE